MRLLDDTDDPIFRRELDQATTASTAFDLPAIAQRVVEIAARHGRSIRYKRVATRNAPITTKPKKPQFRAFLF